MNSTRTPSNQVCGDWALLLSAMGSVFFCQWLVTPPPLPPKKKTTKNKQKQNKNKNKQTNKVDPKFGRNHLIHWGMAKSDSELGTVERIPWERGRNAPWLKNDPNDGEHCTMRSKRRRCSCGRLSSPTCIMDHITYRYTHWRHSYDVVYWSSDEAGSQKTWCFLQVTFSCLRRSERTKKRDGHFGTGMGGDQKRGNKRESRGPTIYSVHSLLLNGIV